MKQYMTWLFIKADRTLRARARMAWPRCLFEPACDGGVTKTGAVECHPITSAVRLNPKGLLGRISVFVQI